MKDQTKKIVKDSFNRCKERDGLFERFYEIFIETSDEAKEKFKNTDMKKQVEMLMHSFYTIQLAPTIGDNLKELAVVHGKKGMNISPELYDVWLDCLMQAVMEFDPEMSFEVDAAWRRLMQPGIEYMKNHSGAED
jgi:hemoglobin-like flavoprotein